MKTYKTIKKEVEELQDVICDCCFNSCKVEKGFEYMELKANWGYFSKKDLTHWTAHICEECVDAKLDFISFNKVELAFGKPTIEPKK